MRIPAFLVKRFDYFWWVTLSSHERVIVREVLLVFQQDNTERSGKYLYGKYTEWRWRQDNPDEFRKAMREMVGRGMLVYREPGTAESGKDHPPRFDVMYWRFRATDSGKSFLRSITNPSDDRAAP